jgi:hypothetical protein
MITGITVQRGTTVITTIIIGACGGLRNTTGATGTATQIITGAGDGTAIARTAIRVIGATVEPSEEVGAGKTKSAAYVGASFRVRFQLHTLAEAQYYRARSGKMHVRAHRTKVPAKCSSMTRRSGLLAL